MHTKITILTILQAQQYNSETPVEPKTQLVYKHTTQPTINTMLTPI